MAKVRIPKPEYAAAVQRLKHLLKSEPWGATVTLEQMSKVIGWDITHRRTVFYAASNQVTGETGRTFEPIDNVGYTIVPPKAQPALPLVAAPPQQMKMPEPEPAPPAPKPVTVQPLPVSPWAEVEAALRRAILHTAQEALDGMDPER